MTLEPHPPAKDPGAHRLGSLIRRISRLEKFVAAISLLVLAILAFLEPEIIEAPFASNRAIAFTVGSVVLAAGVFVALLVFRVPAIARILILGIPFIAASWWLIEPYFVDDVVDDEFAASIVDSTDAVPEQGNLPSDDNIEQSADSTPTSVAGSASPQLVASGKFVGLAGHKGEGDAGLFELPDGRFVLRLENFAIDNGPDLRIYLVPGEGKTSPNQESINLGDLKGNVGNQTYEISASFDPKIVWTALVWCEAFSVEFVGATLTPF